MTLRKIVLRFCQIVLQFFTNESANSAPKIRTPILTASENFNFFNFESLSQQPLTTKEKEA